MDAEWSLAATEDDPILVVPWHDESGASQFIDLQSDLTLIDQIPEACTSPQLRAALLSLNREASTLSTAKCDFWSLSEEEKQLDFELFASGFGSYFDVMQRDIASFSSLSPHISEAQRLTAAAIKIPLDDARAEFVIRPARWHHHDGYAITIYAYGYGATDESAHTQWAHALSQVVALLERSAREKHETLE